MRSRWKQKKLFTHLLSFVLFAFATIFFVSLTVQQLNSYGEEGIERKFQHQHKHHRESREKIPAKLIRVVDGDTLLVSLDGKRERVRLIGIDSPESVKPESPVECYGEEAKAYLTSLLPRGSQIFLQYDRTQGKRDRFGRILAYVFTRDGENIAEEILRNGYAREYNYQKGNPYRLRNAFIKDEREARGESRGLWAVCH